MNILVIVIVLFLIMFAITGFKKGLIKEATSVIGMILIFVIAYILREPLGNFLCKYLPFFQFGGTLEGMTAINILIYQLIAFLIIYSLLFSVYTIVLHLSGILQKLVNMTVILYLPSKIGGAIIGLLEGYIVLFIVLLVAMIPCKDKPIFLESKLTNQIVYHTPILSKGTGSMTNSIQEIYDLGDQLSKNELTTNEANLKTIDVMLKYKVVRPKTVEQLEALDKLKGIQELDDVIKKYQE